MKYVILEVHSGLELPFIFPSTYNHNEFVGHIPHVKVVSAGECKMDDLRKFHISKHGSVSLKIEFSLGRYYEDEKILFKHLTDY